MNTDDNSLDQTILDLMLRAGSRWVLWLLLLLSIAAIAVMIERLWFYVQQRRPALQLQAALAALREHGAKQACAKLVGVPSMEAAVARACLARAEDGVAAVEERRAAAIEQERSRYEKRLAFLGTLGANAPFIGLFGTVLGIVRSFTDLSHAMEDPTKVMAGIAEALVATGVGLIVALPAVATYNAFVRHCEAVTSSSEAFAHEILAQLKAVPAADKAA
jgi:biopolymer transport protein ExbB